MSSTRFKEIDGGVTAAEGFVAGSIFCGIKPSNKKRKDLAIVHSEVPSVAAAVFTTNRVKAAPVRVSMEYLRGGQTRAVVANSGNANACTGLDGIDHAKRMAQAAADSLGLRRTQVLVCSTGRIGVSLPIAKIERSIFDLSRRLSRKGGRRAAKALMTSDTFPKECAVEVRLSGGPVRIGGLAKGAGMINPNMATMLCVLTTDAAVERKPLQGALSATAEQSFNRITVDGDMSTNDTVIMLANGRSGAAPLKLDSPDGQLFQAALNHVALRLARMIVEDGEGTGKVVDVAVRGAATHEDARRVAEAIANSKLVKCAWYGGDPNWGRLMDAAGYSGARLREEMIDIYYDGVLAVQQGVASRTPPEKVRRIARGKRFTVTLDLHMGSASYTVYTTDLTPEYVDLNKAE